ncbi:MAG: exodeoxyribonuclease VII large subunit [Candidatus Methanomethylophilaceae archaeon]|jgi:exodeoxyribonuclease VII large subunit|nr:exodeoxyribonuclease VII large subunit [Candidatus Methanomethylophilaceae archaeon]NCA73474.1 exodeoxyribonuclease VII large subunit [Gammaproteobacteria bacterium]MDD2936321.1 exodeoxyribonuclease VII large subunit [Candidatus Methanomethylophilaceae archaeon]MDD3351189.1 exodeoxyribonuclease VII large subunit [Candidatus Methanomethylophilaceae archaeon]MDD3986237.1 exodeoxyribonuclease VII large subunit [Candidatus Methanomethylophilaceae archaeon]
MADRLTVTQLNTRVRSILSESSAVKDVWVIGEISNLKLYSSGHYYFTLKDEGSEIRSVMFRGSRGRIDFEPADNMKVTAFGHVDLYVAKGSYQFIAETMTRSGIGDLFLEYEKLRKRLEGEGMFDASRKRKLPVYPKVIGVVTSESGAVIHDIVTTSGRLFPADILLAPAQVQGEGAAESIVRGIEALNREKVDVIIVGRGGGSIEDLWAFNEEIVARAIATSEAPVISAVGHESDFTIADFVADVRAPTPTGAAELALRDKREVVKQVDGLGIRMGRALDHISVKMRSRLELAASKLEAGRQHEKLSMLEIRVGQLSEKADAALRSSVQGMRSRFNAAESKISPSAAQRKVASLKDRLSFLSERMVLAIGRCLKDAGSKLDAIGQRSSDLDPRSVLDRGYSYVADSEGRALTSARSLSPGSIVSISFRDGGAEAEIRKVKYYERRH